MLRNFTSSYLFSKSAIVAYICALTLHPASGGVDNAFGPNLCGQDDWLVQCSSAADSDPIQCTIMQGSALVYPRECTAFSPFERAVDKYTPLAEVAGSYESAVFKQAAVAERAVFKRFTFMNFPICQFMPLNQ